MSLQLIYKQRGVQHIIRHVVHQSDSYMNEYRALCGKHIKGHASVEPCDGERRRLCKHCDKVANSSTDYLKQ